MKILPTKRQTNISNVLKVFIMAIFVIVFCKTTTVGVFAHEVQNTASDPNKQAKHRQQHARYPNGYEKLLRQLGNNQARVDAYIASMTPDARRRFLAKNSDAMHIKKYEAMEAKKAQVKAKTTELKPARDAMARMIDISQDNNAGCVKCHKVPSLDGTRSTAIEMTTVANNGVPNHPREGYGNGCSDCHVPGWHTPSTNLTFFMKSKYDVCIMLHNAGGGRPYPTHLTHDPLILWAVNGVDEPTLRNSGSASRSSNTQWFTDIRTWYGATTTQPKEEKCRYLKNG